MAGYDKQPTYTVTVAELVVALLKCNQTRQVRVAVANPNDTAFTNEIEIKLDESEVHNSVTIRGWVSCDNEEACAPWDCD